MKKIYCILLTSIVVWLYIFSYYYIKLQQDKLDFKRAMLTLEDSYKTNEANFSSISYNINGFSIPILYDKNTGQSFILSAEERTWLQLAFQHIRKKDSNTKEQYNIDNPIFPKANSSLNIFNK